MMNFFPHFVAVCVDGTFHKYLFNKEGCSREAFDVFVDLPEEDDF